ncbi:uncharacterized protein LOC124459164 [Xenia sp. Carnegie-2017]|uniref:uncharacterized protein LOC124459164 n=1 Tax=Xenia sp. Carnegie-2017 TaxID=2897299 RepID=UPI001F0399D0|nr:uncharacterized protein LOC124459164 [Xenia sp. Carnegie-2017]
MVAKDLMRMSKKFIDEAQQLVRSVEHQTRVVGKRATSGEFLISKNNSSLMISSLMKLRRTFRGYMNDLDELVEYREVISGNKFCKDELLQILKNVDVRYELWKYYEGCGEKIEHWLQTPFFKVKHRD